MRDYTKYEVWNDAIQLAVDVYQITSTFPEGERFGLTTQLRRAIVSVSSNIAEGCSRSSEKEFKHYLEISIGSAFEVKSQMVLSERLKLATSKDVNEIVNKLDKVSKQLSSLRNKLK